VLSALGFLEADFKNEFVQTFIRSVAEVSPDDIWTRFMTLADRAAAWLATQEVAETDRDVSYSIDLRYEQQGFEVTVAVPAGSVALGQSLDTVIAGFHALHERMYGVRFDVPVELVALRVVATGTTPPMQTRFEAASGDGGADPAAALIETRRGWFDGAWHETPNYDRDRLALGMRVEGPAIIRQYDSTTVLLPAHHAMLDEHGNLLIWPNKGEAK